MSSRSSSTVYILLLLAVTASSVWHVLGKVALTQGMDASVFLVYRLLISSAILLLGGMFVLRLPFVMPVAEIQSRLILIGIATFLHSVFFLYGLQLTNPFMCAVMQPAVPVLVWLFSVISGAERSNVRKAIGVALCSLGAAGAAASSSHHAEQTSADAGANFKTGIVLIILQCIFYAIHLVFQQPLLHAMPPVQVVGMLYAIAGFIMLSVAALQTLVVKQFLPVFAPDKVGLLEAPYWGLSPDPTAWLALGFCVLFASVFTHGVYSWATKKVAATTVSVFITIEPLTTTLVSLVITKSGMPSVTEAACAATVGLGVMLVLLGGPGRPHTEEYEMVPKAADEQEFELEDQPEKEMYSRRKRGSSLGDVPLHRI
jgi:drug/metabolite transporter (DMT)-like permease